MPLTLSPRLQPLLHNIQLYKSNQETKQLPLDSPPIKLAFLPQNHPKYFWKRLRTKGRLPTFKAERLDRESPIRKAPISVNMSGWSNSGIIDRPQQALPQTS